MSVGRNSAELSLADENPACCCVLIEQRCNVHSHFHNNGRNAIVPKQMLPATAQMPHLSEINTALELMPQLIIIVGVS